MSEVLWGIVLGAVITAIYYFVFAVSVWVVLG